MKIHFNSRAAAFYPGESFTQTDELESLLGRAKIDLHYVDEGSLHLPLAALVGFSSEAVALPFAGKAPAQSCLLLSGLNEDRLQRILAQLKEAELPIDYKAVLTPKNRDWSFGALVYEMEKEKAIQENTQKSE